LARHAKIRYLIDGANRRIGKLRNNVLEKSWLWQTQLHPAAQLDAAGNAQQFYLYGEKLNVPSYLVNRENGVNITYRVISDHLGSVRLVVNADTGAVAQRLRYDEFGVVLEDTNPGFQPFGYAGGFYDTDTGLVRFGARDYDSATGRWLAKDIIGFSGGVNLFGYPQDPINFVDMTGFSAKDVVSIQRRFDKIVDRMTSDRTRDPSGTINNAKRFWGKLTDDRIGDSNKLDCGEQTEYMNDDLSGRKYDDDWTFHMDAGIGHAWGVATSSNPHDPMIWYDTRANSMSVGSPCPSCVGWFGDSTLYP